jgi:hypothetical protein
MTTQNYMFEWGKNCVTLGYDTQKAANCLCSFGEFCADDSDQFWSGYYDGPRDSGNLFSVPPQVIGSA